MPEAAASSPVNESAKEQMPTMGFLDHLEELRKRIIYSIIAITVGFFACWGYAENIYQIMQRPIMDALQRNGLSAKLVYLNPTEPFNLYLKVGAMAGLFVASPFVLYQLWCFISPGLYRNEKRYVMPFMVSTVALFLAGGYFGYKLVLPAALVFLIGYGKAFQPMITLSEYSSLFLTIIVGLGVIFEMPILVFFLALMGIVSAGWMWRNLRYSILVIFIIAAILTPTTDILNMCIFRSDPGVFPGAHGHRQRRLDVAQPPLFDPRHLYHRRYPHTHHRHPEHVHLQIGSWCFSWRSWASSAPAGCGATSAIRSSSSLSSPLSSHPPPTS